MKEKVKCYICGTEFELDEEGWGHDDCPYCDWTYLGYENELDPDEKESFNSMSINEAKKNVSEGKDIWGEPLKK